MKRTPLVFAAGSVLALALTPLVGSALAPSPAEKMALAATRFLDSLDEGQRKRAAFAWEDPSRLEWAFVPKERAGLPLKLMDDRQRGLAHALLKAGVSELGYEKATQIIELEKVLAEMEKDPVKRDPTRYHFWVFGKPDPKGSWGWKVEGHHVSLNFTVVKGTLLATAPTFLGANPAEVRQGPMKGLRVLRAEEDLGRALVMSFDETTRARVLFDKVAPKEILTEAASKVDPLAPAGLAVAEFSAEQKRLLRRLLREYVATMPAAVAAERMAKLEKAGFEKIHFAWAGGLKKGEPHYYRLQGPTFLIEYDHTQNDANHVHTVWRDFAGDFGRDLIRDHLKTAAH